MTINVRCKIPASYDNLDNEDYVILQTNENNKICVLVHQDGLLLETQVDSEDLYIAIKSCVEAIDSNIHEG